tara:strand:- start:1870 stop:2043 length:174 start_codon:yes stop_codon:yes gene_type:complete
MNADPNRTGFRVGIPLLLLEYPEHPELCHSSQRIADIIIVQLLANNNNDNNEKETIT